MARTAKKSESSQSYDALKEFDGRKYTGMKVGRGHHWHYDAGEWVEKKLSPDRWEFQYAVNKRRHGRAPAGSGVPVGTAYHWYILADQTVTKLDANTYSTAMSGAKFKLAHQRADKATWSASERARRKRLIQILEGMIAELRAQPEASEPATSSVAAAGHAPPTAQPAKRRGAKGEAAAASNGKRARPAVAATGRNATTPPAPARARQRASSRAAA
jgi:hypothetical protein